MRRVFALLACAVTAGCTGSGLGWPGRAPDAATVPVQTAPEEMIRPQARPADGGGVPSGGAQTAAALDTTTEAEKAAAQSAAGGRSLGTTIASLGSPSEPGFWIKTPLVDAPGPGRVENLATGQSVQVELIPLDGPETGGSQLSLAAMRLVAAALTDLPEVRVFALGG